MKENNIIGKGWSFPPRFSVVNDEGIVEMVSDETELREALSIILTTIRGERFLRPDFGVNLREYQFAPITTALKMHMEDLIRHALLRYEPRVTLDNVTITDENSLDGILNIHVAYTINATNAKGNLVYPLYL